MEPMLLKPVGKDYLWGGTRLREEYNKEIDLTPLAETWECSVHPDGPSVVRNGVFQGRTLAEVLKLHPEFLGEKVPSGTGLPILVKFIDAEKDLSVQVHPDDSYAREHEGQNGKTEMWYVVDAKPGTTLVHGFAHSVTAEQLKDAVRTGTMSKHLQKVPVRRGDVFFTPSGTVHAIGAGSVIIEIQTSSNVTYRVYDYDRLDKNGEKRELHLEKAVQVMNMKPGRTARQMPRAIRYYPGYSRELLCRCEYFETEKIGVTKEFFFPGDQTSFQILLCADGEGNLMTTRTGEPLDLKKGDCVFIPAGSGQCRVSGGMTLLRVQI